MIAIKNGRIVLPDRILDGKTLVLDGDRIHSIGEEIPPEAGKVIDAHGRFITPGFFDVHSDKIEQFILPRPTAQFDFELALKECERELLHLGITTIYHSFSLLKDELFGKSPLRTRENVEKMAALIRDIHDRNHLIHHRFHLRIEIDNLDAYDIAKAMIAQGLAHEISFMDHSPGQGQYRNLEIYQKTIRKYHGREIEELGFEKVLEMQRNKKTLSFEQLKELCRFAHENGVAVASHDDDTLEKLDINREIGVDISEFPINLEAAKYARSLGFATVVGAPNILLGGSHSGNMSAAEAIQAGCADILCSDYYPPAILHSIFAMHLKYGVPLPEMVKKATLNPAVAMGLGQDYGSIEPGKKADLLVIGILDGYPVITHVLVDGRTTSRVEYRR
ncbi:MAG TPA: alpha-D-ribose 1-methylphosphonate 5-triphosphate diphosphatase [Candidatus Merdivicinus excrementipullorum]|uniref:Alpha-D-ribose 1-methylphosphonate 5-triphosphate diphosphatase n=1 Tax=Candidatus Merdivicinus excrementipullorum TaxID=2840867 RepID=A0A9D1JZI2_9FIRM|nr:alpha-D-ribose 1-methylphosphonate 5-triphosphate diphosphatase [Candidatus Merdivicinus excrementipullorum]